MKREEILYCLRQIIAPYVQNDKAFESFNEGTGLLTDLEINSSNLIDIILDVEEEFGIEIDNESVERMATVQDAVRLIEVNKERA